MNFRQQLHHIMKEQNISAAELSRRTGIPRQTISDWLNRAEMHTLKQLTIAASALNVSLDQLICGTDHMNATHATEHSNAAPQQHVVGFGIAVSGANNSPVKQQQ